MGGTISRTLQPGDEADLEVFLPGHLESSMFLLGDSHAAGLSDHSGPLQSTYAAVFEGGVITAVAAHFWNGNLVLHCRLRVTRIIWPVKRCALRGGPCEAF